MDPTLFLLFSITITLVLTKWYLLGHVFGLVAFMLHFVYSLATGGDALAFILDAILIWSLASEIITERRRDIKEGDSLLTHRGAIIRLITGLLLGITGGLCAFMGFLPPYLLIAGSLIMLFALYQLWLRPEQLKNPQ